MLGPRSVASNEWSGERNQWNLNAWNKLGSHQKVALPVFTITPVLLDFRQSNLNYSFLSLFPRLSLFSRLPSDRFSLRSQTMQMDKGIWIWRYSTFKRVRYFSCVVYCVCRYHAKSHKLVFSFAPLSTSAISQVKWYSILIASPFEGRTLGLHVGIVNS